MRNYTFISLFFKKTPDIIRGFVFQIVILVLRTSISNLTFSNQRFCFFLSSILTSFKTFCSALRVNSFFFTFSSNLMLFTSSSHNPPRKAKKCVPIFWDAPEWRCDMKPLIFYGTSIVTQVLSMSNKLRTPKY